MMVIQMTGQVAVADYAEGRAPIEAVLEALPDESAREFELSLTALACIPDRVRLTADLRRVLIEAENIELRYAAFYCLNILLRRNKDFSLLEDLINQYRPVFGRHATFGHLFVLFSIERGLGKQKSHVVSMAFDDVEQFPENAGFVHLFADTIASLCEESDEDVAAALATEWLARALSAVDRAISLDRTYAKYYCTKGRLLAIDGEFVDALSLIKTAIDMEDSSRSDYAIRIGNYQYYRLWIQAKRNDAVFGTRMSVSAKTLGLKQASVEEGLATAVARMDASTIKNLEFLGFFAGLISFTIGSIQIAVGQSMEDAARLIVVLMGALLVAFSGFSFILEDVTRRTSIRAAVVAVVGAAVLGVGLFL